MRPKLADVADPDRVVEIDERETIENCFSFVRDYHLLVGGSTGSVLAAIQKLAHEFKPGDTVVGISPDLGDRYLDSVYKRDLMTEQVLHHSNTNGLAVGVN